MPSSYFHLHKRQESVLKVLIKLEVFSCHFLLSPTLICLIFLPLLAADHMPKLLFFITFETANLGCDNQIHNGQIANKLRLHTEKLETDFTELHSQNDVFDCKVSSSEVFCP